MNENIKKSTAKMVIIMMICAILGRGFGFVREIVMGSVLGTTYIADIFSVVVSVQNLIFASIGAVIGTTFIPAFVGLKEQYGKQRSMAFTNNVLTIVLAAGIILAALSVIFAQPLLSFIAHGFNDTSMKTAVDMARIVFLSVAFLGINVVLSSYLNANNKFFVTSIVMIPYNLIIIFALLLFDRFSTQGLAIAAFSGVVLQTVIILINALLSGFKYRPTIDVNDKTLREIIVLAAPVFIGQSVGQVNTIIDRMMASGLAEGSISALNYANKLQLFFYSIFATTISLVIYPKLSKHMVSTDRQAFKELLVKGINFVVLMLTPIAVAVCLLSPYIVKLLFQRGVFDAHSTAMTASALCFYSLGLIFLGCRGIFDRAFYAMLDTKTPMINGIMALIVNILLNFILVRFMAHNGLALSASVAAAVSCILMVYSLRKKMGSIGGAKIINTTIKAFISAAAMGTAVWFTYKFLTSAAGDVNRLKDMFIFALLAVEGVIVYVTMLLVLRVEALNWILLLLRRK